MSRFDVVRDPMLGEEVWTARSVHGLPLRVVPTQRFAEAVAVVAVGYGSTDLGFAASPDAPAHDSPEGVAHYLEHKLFEDEELKVFDRFARRGARVNATTGFVRTHYFFSATEQLEANLQDLLRLVGKPHITDENVAKERGIIAQEIRMYEDSPDYRGFFDLLRCLYREHPVRHPVGGTVESIAAIDRDELLRCYHAFYRAGNAAMAVAGPVEPEAVLALLDGCALPPGPAPQSRCPADLCPPVAARHDRTMQVARPRVLLGCKDPDLAVDVAGRLRRQLVTRLLLEGLFSPSADVRHDLAERGVVDDSLSYAYMAERSFGFVVLSGESEEPQLLEAELRAALSRPLPMTEVDLERMRRRVLGQYVRSFESARAMAFAHVDQALEGVPPFELLQRLRSITLDDLRSRHRELFATERLAVAQVAPPR